jgi:DNA replication protein DnaC
MKPDLTNELETLLRELRLPEMRACYQEVALQARKESLSFERFFLELVRREAESRSRHRIERALRVANLPAEKTLAAFDRSRLPRKVDAHVAALVEGDFLGRAENVLAFGNPGSGKTHLACGIGRALIEKGYTVLFRPCNLLVQDLLISKRDLNLAKAFKKLASFDALIIDDIGYVQQSRQEMEVLFALLAERYERKSVIITSNLPFSKWEQIFKDPMTTAAAVDRLVHHSVVLELNLKSFRLEQSKTAKAGKGEDQG